LFEGRERIEHRQELKWFVMKPNLWKHKVVTDTITTYDLKETKTQIIVEEGISVTICKNGGKDRETWDFQKLRRLSFPNRTENYPYEIWKKKLHESIHTLVHQLN